MAAGSGRAKNFQSVKAKINFKIRDAVFSRQRYWGEPVPVYFDEDTPEPLSSEELPLILPEIIASLSGRKEALKLPPNIYLIASTLNPATSEL